MATKIQSGSSTSGLANVDSAFQLQVVTEKNVLSNPGNVGGIKNYSENDSGSVTGVPYLKSPETDDDYRLRVSQDTLFDNEVFNYTAQNTGKHNFANTTLTAAWSASGFQTNSGAVTTTTTGLTFGTYRMFPLLGSMQTYISTVASFNNQPTTNTIIDFGLFLRGGGNPYAPTDGVYFRLTSAGLLGVINSNGTETTVALAFTYNTNEKYNFVIVLHEQVTEFWIEDILYGKILTPIAQGQPFMSAALPWSVRHAIVGGAAGAIISMFVNDYYVSMGGNNTADDLGSIMNRCLGSYQGLSGGTMGSLTVYANSTNPTAAVPSNTALTANLPGGLGGQAWETYTTGLAANTDGILMSYQVPAGTVAVQGRALKVTGVKLSAFIQTVLTGGGFNTTFALAFGGTNVSLATAESAAAKARRIVLLPELTQAVTAAQAANTMVSQPGGCICMFPEPIYVNPGEFIQLVIKHIGSVATAGVIGYNIQYVYGWE